MKKQPLFLVTLIIFSALSAVLVLYSQESAPVDITDIDVPEDILETDADMPESSGPESDIILIEDTALPPEETGENPETIEVPVSTDTAEEEEPDSGLISIAFEEVPLQDVVKAFTRMSGANIISNSTNLMGTVNVSLSQVEWKPALLSILEAHQLTLIERSPGSGVYTIVDKDPNAPPPQITEKYQLKHATVSEVGAVITNMYGSAATVSTFPSRNLLIVRSTANNLSELKDLIDEIDKPVKQVCIETKFVQLSEDASEKIGIDWGLLDEFTMAADLGMTYSETRQKIVTDERGSLSLRNPYWGRQRDLENNIPVAGGDIGVEGETHEVYNIKSEGENMSSIGIDEEGALTWDSVIPYAMEDMRSAVLSLDQFRLVLSALKQTDGVTIVSNPKMIVASGYTNATFHVGEREPIILTEVTKGTTDSPGDTFAAKLDTDINTDRISGGFVRTGIELKVVPVVKTEELIEAFICPTLSRTIDRKEIALIEGSSQANSWPVISIKSIETKFTLKSGQTVAIGGLIDTLDQKVQKKIPLLGSIPLIGKYLFSHTTDVKSTEETVIFVSLALAEPMSLVRESGIPSNARLIHDRMLRDDVEAYESKQEIDKKREKTEKRLLRDRE